MTDLPTLLNVLQLPSFALMRRNVHQGYAQFQPLARTRKVTAMRGVM
jgi:hypothetical protein